MDQNGENIPSSDSPFSFRWLLCGDDWHRWDTFPTVDGDPTVEINHDGPTIESHDNPLPITLTREEMVRQWLQSHTNEHFEAPPQDEYIEMTSDEDTFTYEELLDLTEQIGDVCIGLTIETIDENLKPRKYEDCCGEREKCVICLHKLKYNEDASKLGCGHDFHFGCIKEWLMVKNVCPLCKQKAL